jgi:hypothetical protein
MRTLTRTCTLHAGRFSVRVRLRFLAALATLASLIFLACDTSSLPEEKTYFRLQADSTWLGYDSLQVWLDKGDGAAPSLLFAAKLSSVSDLDRIPADGYGKGAATLILRAYKDGRVARAENRGYDFARQLIVGITVLVPPGSGAAKTDSAIAKGGLFLSLRPGDTLVSIGDSVPLIAAGWNDSGSLLEAQWDFDGDGAPDRVEHPAAASAVLRAQARFSEPGVYHPSLTLKGSQGGSLMRAVTVRVNLDPPYADAGPDLKAGADSELVLIGKGTDSLGRIVKQEWQVGDLPPQSAPGGKLAFRTPSTPGDLLAIFRVTDDDGLIAIDTVFISVTGPSGTGHTPMPSGMNLTIGAQGSASYGAVIDIDSARTWTSAVANAHQSGIDLVFLYYGSAFHLEDAVNAKASGIANSINMTNTYDDAKIVHVDMVRITSEPADQESAQLMFDSADVKIHGAAVVAGDMFLVKSTGGKLALVKMVSFTGTDKAGQAVAQLKTLTL